LHQPYTIIWDFDGTLLPSVFDSEQTLLLFLLHHPDTHWNHIHRLIARMAIHADRKEWLGPNFKPVYLRLLKNTPVVTLDPATDYMSKKITDSDKQTLRALSDLGFPMQVISCGTTDLSRKILEKSGLSNCFQQIHANPFKINAGRINGMDFQIRTGRDKVKLAVKQGFDPNRTVAIGDGYTDMPLLNWARYGLLLRRNAEPNQRPHQAKYIEVNSIAEAGSWITGHLTATNQEGTHP
jgi:phosphoserine phosphatase